MSAPDTCESVLSRYAASELSAPVAIMQMLILSEDANVVAAAIRARASESPRTLELARLFDENAEGCARIASMLQSDMDTPPLRPTARSGAAFCKRLFDWSVQQSAEASVALYSLGSAELLRTLTDEIVTVLDAWGVFGPDKVVLDLGCGIGRMEEALAPRVSHVHGIDVSEKMIDVARRRCASTDNVSLSICNGLDLAPFADHSFDLVLAVDSMPYMVQSGMALVAHHFAEVARVLRRDGDFVILNFSYREDVASDRKDIALLADSNGFDVVVDGTSPFALWDGTAFRMKKRVAVPLADHRPQEATRTTAAIRSTAAYAGRSSSSPKTSGSSSS
ncbi:MAG: methyltransferase domain-containing protein [Myxococcota bacterium]|nr:methyltransferase domain-containing protein [Myxococcota bacterium]